MKSFVPVAAMLSLALTGCSSSVHPLLTDQDLSRDLDLNGKWHQIKVEEHRQQIPDFTCEGYDDNSKYDLMLGMGRPQKLREGQKVIPSEYDLAIGKIDGTRYLQLSRSEMIAGGPSFFEGVVTYTFAKIELQENLLLVYPINDQALETLLPKTKMSHLMHKPSDLARNIVITESTSRLQRFLRTHGARLFDPRPLTFQRGDKSENR